MSATSEVYQTDVFQARKKIFTVFGAQFHLQTPEGRVLAYSRQKAFKLKEDIRVFTDETQQVELLQIRADRVVDFSASYSVVDGQTGELYGSLRRKGWSSLFRDSWEILDAQGVVRGRVLEDGGWKAFLRRMNELFALFAPQTFRVEVGGQTVATMTQNFNPFVQKFSVDMTPDVGGMLPRPLAIATVVLLLAIEGRQK